MCCQISFCDDFFAVCNIRPVLGKKNTKFGNEYRSYQLSDVSIFKMRLLTIIMLKKVYKNENCFSENEELYIRNMAEIKLFGLNEA